MPGKQALQAKSSTSLWRWVRIVLLSLLITTAVILLLYFFSSATMITVGGLLTLTGVAALALPLVGIGLLVLALVGYGLYRASGIVKLDMPEVPTVKKELSAPISSPSEIKFKLNLPTVSDKDYEKCLLERPNPDEIIPGLFLGHSTSGDEWLESLQKNESSKKVILRCIHGPLPTTVSEETRASLEEKKALKVIEVGDSKDARLDEHFDSCFEFIDTALAQNKKVLVHCNAGASRSPTIVAAYLIRKYGLTAEEAINHIGHARPIVIRDMRPEFKQKLEAYAKSLRSSARIESHQTSLVRH